MTVTDFMVKYAAGGYVGLDKLYVAARETLLRPGEGKGDFVKLVEAWLRKYPDGHLPDGATYYTEIPLGRRGLTAKSARASRVARIMVVS